MKTLAQEIGALVGAMTIVEHETSEQFEERIGRAVLERLTPCPRCGDVHDRRLGCSELSPGLKTAMAIVKAFK